MLFTYKKKQNFCFSDAFVKSKLILDPRRFAEWLMQIRLVRSQQNGQCRFHPSNSVEPLQLGMYNEEGKFPYRLYFQSEHNEFFDLHTFLCIKVVDMYGSVSAVTKISYPFFANPFLRIPLTHRLSFSNLSTIGRARLPSTMSYFG